MSQTSMDHWHVRMIPKAAPTGDAIELAVRTADFPYAKWPATGHLPFEVHGERFAVTANPSALAAEQEWRVSHVGTGMAVPRAKGATMEQAREKAIAVLTEVGPERLRRAIEDAERMFARAEAEPKGAEGGQ